MHNRPLILVGGGGHCKCVIEVAENLGIPIYGIIDIPEKVGEKVIGYDIIGSDIDIPKYINQANFIITLGQITNAKRRVELANLISACGGNMSSIISPDSYVSKYASIGQGTVILHKVVVNAGAAVGKCCIINNFSDIEHDANIGDFCHISTGAIVNGGSTLGSYSFVGSQSVINNNINICDNVVIASLSVVTTNIYRSGLYVGSPANIYHNL